MGELGRLTATPTARCWIDDAAMDDLLAEARGWCVRETGGALLGWRDGPDVAVACVLGPGPNATHRLRSFEPDGPWQVAQGRRIYAATGRRVAYLGDWHTHPLGSARPSEQDRTAMRGIAGDPNFGTREPLSAIVGCAAVSRRRLVVHIWDGAELRPIETTRCRLPGDLVAIARRARSRD